MYDGEDGCNNTLLLMAVAGGSVPRDLAWRSCWIDHLPGLVQRLQRRRLLVEAVQGSSVAMRLIFDASQANIDKHNWFK